MNKLVLVALCLVAAPALAVEPLNVSDFFLVAKLTAKSTLSDAQSEYGLGFINSKRDAVSFSATGKDGATYRLYFTPGTEIAFDCGWLQAKAPGDRLNALCSAPNEVEVRKLLAAGQDRNQYLRLIGARLKGVQVDFGKALVTVALPDPQKPPVSVAIAWCTSGCGS
jgi:hypothetical protein